MMRRAFPVAMRLSLVLVASLAALCLLSSCAKVVVDEHSPHVAAVSLDSASSMTEASQRVSMKVEFDDQVSVSGNVLDDLDIRLNGELVDEAAVKMETHCFATGFTIALTPTEAAVSGSALFALYQGDFVVSAKRSDGALQSVVSSSGSCAVLDQPLQATLPSGLSFEVIEQRAGSVDEGAPAKTVVRVSSPACVRLITWFSLDGGDTILLKHNHFFASCDAQDCASDLADVINHAQDASISASAVGDTLVLMAHDVIDGQLIDPVVVEGVGIEGGSYDASRDGAGF